MKRLLLLILIILLTGCTVSKPPSQDENNENPSVEEPTEPMEPTDPIEPDPEDTTIFHEYKEEAIKIVNDMTLEEKIGQMFLVRCPLPEQLDQYLSMNPGGFILFGRDFEGKTKEQVKGDIGYYQDNSTIPMIIAVDEEGGTVVRVSSNPLLYKERFKSPQELYDAGGFERISSDTIEKSKLLLSLGINLNLAPVVDVSVDEMDFIYNRTFGKPVSETAEYVRTVVEAAKSTNISSTLKHFPGYGNNKDTHTGSAYDLRPYEEFINSDFIPFKAGIEAGAESILVSHNVVAAIDEELPASLSKKVIDILRNDLQFTGIVITDDLSMRQICLLKYWQSWQAMTC
jgi:beta-N-acetylhexosaminidase